MHVNIQLGHIKQAITLTVLIVFYYKTDENVVVRETLCCLEISSPLEVRGREMVVSSRQEGMPLSPPPVVKGICVCVFVCLSMCVSLYGCRMVSLC